MPATYIYNVRVFYTGIPVLPNIGYIFGPFQTSDAAEQCLVAVASRDNVRSATIEKVEVA